MEKFKQVITLFFISSILWSQSNKDQLDYFPVHIGDIWQYNTYITDVIQGKEYKDYNYKTIEIIGDTLCSGYYYYKFRHKSKEGIIHEYLRIDTISLSIWEYNSATICGMNDRKRYDLSLNEPYTWNDCGMFTINGPYKSSEPQLVGELSNKTYQLLYQSNNVAYKKRYLSKGFGYSRKIGGDAGVNYQEMLNWARINGKEYGTFVGIDMGLTIPNSFNLLQNYPNPFNPSTTIRYQIPVVDALSEAEVPVTLKVYDMLGREVATLVNEEKSPGIYNVKFDVGHSERSRGIASGIYIYQIKAGGFTEIRKMILLK